MMNDYFKLMLRLTVVCVHRSVISLRGPIEKIASPSLSSASSVDVQGACKTNKKIKTNRVVRH